MNNIVTDEQIQGIYDLEAAGAAFSIERYRWENVPIEKVDEDGTHPGWVYGAVQNFGGRDYFMTVHEWYTLSDVEEGMTIADDLMDGYLVFINNEAQDVPVFDSLEEAIGWAALESGKNLVRLKNEGGAGPYGYYSDAWRNLRGRATKESWNWHPEADSYLTRGGWTGSTTGTSATISFDFGTSTTTTGTYYY